MKMARLAGCWAPNAPLRLHGYMTEFDIPYSVNVYLPARRRPQGLVVIGVCLSFCLSVCLCVCAHSVRKISQERVHGSPPNLVGGSRGEPLERVQFWCWSDSGCVYAQVCVPLGHCSLMINLNSFGFQPGIVSCQKILAMCLWSYDNSAKWSRPNMCTVINGNAYFFTGWLLYAVVTGQVFKYSRMVFKYQHQYLGI